MAITAVSKLRPRGAAQFICACQSLAVWKGRRQFDSRKTFPLLFTGSEWGGLLFIPAKRNSSRVLVCGLTTQRHRGVEQPAGTMGMFTQATEFHGGKKPHVCSLSQWNSRLGKHQGLRKYENIQGAEEETYKWKAGRAPLQNQGAGCGGAALG